MAFNTGPITFRRFAVEGDSIPAAVDATVLASLTDQSFRQVNHGEPDRIEHGWLAGDHMLDVQFSHEKNAFGAVSDRGASMLFWAIRIDTHQVPADVKAAHRRINEAAAAAGNPSGFISRKQKAECLALTQRQIRDEVATGRFRKTKCVQLLWDLPAGILYVGSLSESVAEVVSRQMSETFGVKLTALSAGVLAERLVPAANLWDHRPSALTPPPPRSQASADEDTPRPSEREWNLPLTPWAFKPAPSNDWIGNEFLLWLWWEANVEAAPINLPDAKTSVAVMLDRSLDMDCAWGVGGRQTLRGDGPGRMPEAMKALASGKWPRKAGLIIHQEEPWGLTLQGDRFHVSAGALPPLGEKESVRECVEARLEAVKAMAALLDDLFRHFVAIRMGSEWDDIRRAIMAWSQGLTAGHAADGTPPETEPPRAQTKAVEVEEIRELMEFAFEGDGLTVSGVMKRFGLGYPAAFTAVESLANIGLVSRPTPDCPTAKLKVTRDRWDKMAAIAAVTLTDSGVAKSIARHAADLINAGKARGLPNKAAVTRA